MDMNKIKKKKYINIPKNGQPVEPGMQLYWRSIWYTESQDEPKEPVIVITATEHNEQFPETAKELGAPHKRCNNIPFREKDGTINGHRSRFFETEDGYLVGTYYPDGIPKEKKNGR